MVTDMFDEGYERAVFSADRAYRMALRRGSMANPLLWLLLNPSTAGEDAEDPTSRRVQWFSTQFGYTGSIIGNLFALCATNPKTMLAHSFPIGPDNDEWLLRLAAEANGNIICGWGVHGAYMRRGREVLGMLRDKGYRPRALELTKDGHPKHPLYILGTARPFYFGEPVTL